MRALPPLALLPVLLLAGWLLAGLARGLGAGPWASLLPPLTLLPVLLLAGWLLGGLARGLGAGPRASLLPGLALLAGPLYLVPRADPHWLVLVPLAGALIACGRGLTAKGPGWWAVAGGLSGLVLLGVAPDGLVLAGVAVACAGADRVIGQASGALTTRRLGAFAAGGAPLALAWLACWGPGLADGPDVRFATDLAAYLSPSQGWTSLPAFWARAAHALALYAAVVAAAVASLAWAAGIVARRLRAGVRWDPAEAAWGVVCLAALGFGGLTTCGPADLAHVALHAAPALVAATAAASALARRLAEPGLAGVRWLPLGAIMGFVGAGAVLWAAAVRRALG